jgi:hypothetical protein
MTANLTGEGQLEALAGVLDDLDLDAYTEGDLDDLLGDIAAATNKALRAVAAEQDREIATLQTHLRQRRFNAEVGMMAAREILTLKGLSPSSAPRLTDAAVAALDPGRPRAGAALTRKSATGPTPPTAPARDRSRETYRRCVAAYGIHACEAYRP